MRQLSGHPRMTSKDAASPCWRVRQHEAAKLEVIREHSLLAGVFHGSLVTNLILAAGLDCQATVRSPGKLTMIVESVLIA